MSQAKFDDLRERLAEISDLVKTAALLGWDQHVMMPQKGASIRAEQMATVGRIRYAGADPYGGGDGGLLGTNPHVERLPLALEGPRRDPFGRLASGLLVAFFLERNPAGHVVRAFGDRAPEIVDVARALLAGGVRSRAADGVGLRGALPALWPELG